MGTRSLPCIALRVWPVLHKYLLNVNHRDPWFVPDSGFTFVGSHSQWIRHAKRYVVLLSQIAGFKLHNWRWILISSRRSQGCEFAFDFSTLNVLRPWAQQALLTVMTTKVRRETLQCCWNVYPQGQRCSLNKSTFRAVWQAWHFIVKYWISIRRWIGLD